MSLYTFEDEDEDLKALYTPVADMTDRQVKGRQGLHKYLTTGVEKRVVGVNKTYGKHSGIIESEYPSSGAINLVPITEDPIFMLATAGGVTAASKGTSLLTNVVDEFTMGASSIGRAGVKGIKNVVTKQKPSKSVYSHDTNNYSLINEKTIIEDGKEISIPYNTFSGKSLQDQYIDETLEWYSSPQFKSIMKENYPDMDVDTYIEKTMANLKGKKLTVDESVLSEGAMGTYYPKKSSSIVYAPWHTPTFKQKINNANNINPEYDKGFGDVTGRPYVNKVLSASYHELGHLRTNANELIPDNLIEENLSKNYIGDKTNKKYLTYKTEVEVRLQQLRKDIKEERIANFHNEEITEDHIKKYFGNKSSSKITTDKLGIDKALKDNIISKNEHDNIIKGLYINKQKGSKGLLSSDALDLRESFTPKYISSLLKGLPVVAGASVISKATIDSLYNSDYN